MTFLLYKCKICTDKKSLHPEQGFLLLSVIIMMSITLIVVLGLLSSRRMEAKLRTASNKINSTTYVLEQSTAKTVVWLQENSEYLVGLFLAANYNTYFDIGSPQAGLNDTPQLSIPTTVKYKATSNSVFLSNDNSLGISTFPNTTHILTNAAFNPVEAFQAADLGDAKVRLTLVWLTNAGEDKQPVFRLDVLSRDLGLHIYSYIKGNLISTTTSLAAFYSTTEEIKLATANNSCKSNSWKLNGSNWDSGALKSNCHIASNSNIIVKGSVYGNVLSLADIRLTAPGGKISGTACEQQVDCHSLSLSNFDTWDSVCGAINRGDLNITANTLLPVSSDNPADNCWRDVVIDPDTTLTLETEDIPYHFRKITYSNSSSSKLAFADIPEGQNITLYVESFSSNTLNGNKFYNVNNAPHQVKLNMTGENTLRINGTSPVRVDLTAPQSEINLRDNFNFYGGIKAKQIHVTDLVTLIADEALYGAATITKMSFSIKQTSQVNN